MWARPFRWTISRGARRSRTGLGRMWLCPAGRGGTGGSPIGELSPVTPDSLVESPGRRKGRSRLGATYTTIIARSGRALVKYPPRVASLQISRFLTADAVVASAALVVSPVVHSARRAGLARVRFTRSVGTPLAWRGAEVVCFMQSFLPDESTTSATPERKVFITHDSRPSASSRSRRSWVATRRDRSFRHSQRPRLSTRVVSNVM